MLHRIYDSDVLPPAPVATTTAIVSLLAEVNSLEIGGLLISAGWLALGVYDRVVKGRQK